MKNTDAREKLKAGYLIDKETGLVERHYAVIRKSQRSRDRFPENCVELKGSREEAIAAADPAQRLEAALVYGPSRSSEGFRLYYLIEWL